MSSSEQGVDLFPKTPIEVTIENWDEAKRQRFFESINGKGTLAVNFDEFYRNYVLSQDQDAGGSKNDEFHKTIDDFGNMTNHDHGHFPWEGDDDDDDDPGDKGDDDGPIDPVDPDPHPVPVDPRHPIVPIHLIPRGHVRVIGIVELPMQGNSSDVLLMEM